MKAPVTADDLGGRLPRQRALAGGGQDRDHVKGRVGKRDAPLRFAGEHPNLGRGDRQIAQRPRNQLVACAPDAARGSGGQPGRRRQADQGAGVRQLGKDDLGTGGNLAYGQRQGDALADAGRVGAQLPLDPNPIRGGRGLSRHEGEGQRQRAHRARLRSRVRKNPMSAGTYERSVWMSI